MVIAFLCSNFLLKCPELVSLRSVIDMCANRLFFFHTQQIPTQERLSQKVIPRGSVKSTSKTLCKLDIKGLLSNTGMTVGSFHSEMSSV